MSLIISLLTQGGPPPPPPVPTTPGIQNWLILGLIIILYGVGYFFIRMIDSGRTFEIRRIPALDAVDQAIGRATEMGRSVLFIPGPFTRPGTPLSVSVAGVFQHVTEETARLDTDFFVPFDTSEVILASWLADIAQASYTAAGIPEKFDKNTNFNFMGQAHSWAVATLGWIADNKPAAMIHMCQGAAWTRNRFPEEAARYGALTIGGFMRGIEFLVFYDYFMVSEELLAAGAYITKDKALVGALIAGDALKYMLLSFILILAIANASGAGLLNWMMGYLR